MDTGEVVDDDGNVERAQVLVTALIGIGRNIRHTVVHTVHTVGTYGQYYTRYGRNTLRLGTAVYHRWKLQ